MVLRLGCGDVGRAAPTVGVQVIALARCDHLHGRAISGLFWSSPATSAAVPGRGSATRSRRWCAPSPVSAGPDRSRARGGHPRAARRRRHGRIHRYVDSSAPDRLRPSVRRNTTSRPLHNLLIRSFGQGSSTGRPAAMRTTNTRVRMPSRSRVAGLLLAPPTPARRGVSFTATTSAPGRAGTPCTALRPEATASIAQYCHRRRRGRVLDPVRRAASAGSPGTRPRGPTPNGPTQRTAIVLAPKTRQNRRV
jgi:hypothetical protein